MVAKAMLTGVVSVTVVAFLTFIGGMTEDIFAGTAEIMSDISNGTVSEQPVELITESDISEIQRLSENMKQEAMNAGTFLGQ